MDMCLHSLTIILEIKKVQGRMARMINSLHIAGKKKKEKKKWKKKKKD